MPNDRIVAVALRPQSNLDAYGAALKKVYRINDAPVFDDLVAALDEADREHWSNEDRIEARRKLRTTGGG